MHKKQIRTIIIVVIVNVVLLEVLSFAFLEVAKRTHSHYFAVPLSHYEELISEFDDAAIREIVDRYDSLLVWDTRPNTVKNLTDLGGKPYSITINENGERSTTDEYESVLISTYGDSHTLCDEVNDDETWQVELSKRIGAQVQNFGVGGFGTDQAVLKLERNLKEGHRTPYVSLGIHEENIGRILNTYRPFYTYAGATRPSIDFKPRFVLDSDELRLLPAPIAFSTVDGATDALRFAARNDYWYSLNQAQMAHVRPPFTWRALDLSFIVAERRGLIDHPFKGPITYCPSCWTPPSPWDSLEADALMSGIVDKYIQLSREYSFHPILIFFPFIAPVSESGTGYLAPYDQFVANLRRRYTSDDLTVIDIGERIFSEGSVPIELPLYRVTKNGGHTSAYGNRIIAEFVYDSLAKSHMFDLN